MEVGGRGRSKKIGKEYMEGQGKEGWGQKRGARERMKEKRKES